MEFVYCSMVVQVDVPTRATEDGEVQRGECPILSCKGEYQVGWRLYFTLCLQLACLGTPTDNTNIRNVYGLAME